MRRAADGFLERAREMRRRKPCFAGKLVDRQTRIRLGVHSLENTSPNAWCKAAVSMLVTSIIRSSLPNELQSQRRRQHLDEREAARCPRTCFGRERT